MSSSDSKPSKSQESKPAPPKSQEAKPAPPKQASVRAHVNWLTESYDGFHNHWTGQVGFEFKTHKTFKISGLARGINVPEFDVLKEKSTVMLWNVETKKRLMKLEIGPDSLVENRYAIAYAKNAVEVEGDKLYRISQVCYSGMKDMWNDNYNFDANQCMSDYATLTEGCFNNVYDTETFPFNLDGPKRRVGMLSFLILQNEEAKVDDATINDDNTSYVTTTKKRTKFTMDENDDIDFTIFEQDNAGKCDQTGDDPIGGCIAVRRLVVSLIYYTRLDVQNSKAGYDIFAMFLNDVYTRSLCLDDYAHLVKEHNKNLEVLSKALKEIKSLALCEVTKCAFTSRHHSRESNRQSTRTAEVSQPSEDDDGDDVMQFYFQTIDSFHFYVMHLFESGLRTEAADAEDIDVDNGDGDGDDDRDDNVYVDMQFESVSNKVRARKPIREGFARFQSADPNNKFNMQTAATATTATDGSPGSTFMDEVVRYLLAQNIKDATIIKITTLFGNENYDTDSTKEDIKQELKGIIARDIDDEDAIQLIAKFVKDTEVRSSSFSLGVIYYYWPHYEKMDEFDENTNNWNINDHSGHKVSHLFVRQRHDSFKEEIMNYSPQFMDMARYRVVMTKVKEFMRTESIKKLKAYNDKSNGYIIVLNYDIEHEAPVLARHLVSLFLYTDCTKLCTHFSSTFRATKAFETLSSMKARNAKYWWMSKSLREMVELYGESQFPFRGSLEGPYFCGVSVVMPFPEFEVRLCGPSSTSYQVTVAFNFAGEKGMVVQLNNNVNNHGFLSGFRCSWLSDFKEEDEVLWFGGHHRIKIESVRVVKGKNDRCQNFGTFFGALFELNKMFNGGFANRGIVTKTQKAIIKILIKWAKKKSDINIDQYVLDTFNSFCQQKTYIVLNLPFLCEYNDQGLSDMIFYGTKMSADFKPEKEDKTNIFKKDLFKVFENIQNIDIYTTGIQGIPVDRCALSFAALLDEIEQESWTQVTVKATQDKYWAGNKNKESWIYFAWQETSQELIEQCKKKRCKISLETTKNEGDCLVDCLVIKKL